MRGILVFSALWNPVVRAYALVGMVNLHQRVRYSQVNTFMGILVRT